MRKCFLTYKAIVLGAKRMKSEMADLALKQVYKSIIEGRAVLRVTSDNVFYNPVQEFNRDLSIAVLTIFIEDFKKEKLLEAEKRRPSVDSDECMEDDKKVDITILEALSATGLRSIRYAKEVVDLTKVIANDIAEEAVKTIKENIAFNNVDHIVQTSHEDASLLMYKHKHRMKRFTAIDLDPYGSPAMFLDAAVQSVADGGLLLVTATDMAVMTGNAPETCHSKYGAVSLRTKSCHEMALRILLQSIEAHANRYNRYIVPMLSVSVDFYIRVFVKVYTGAAQCKHTTSKLSMVYRCVGCDANTLQPLGGFRDNPTSKTPNQKKAYLPTAPPVGEFCENCNQKHQMGGPIWSAAMHDESFVTRVLYLVQDTPSHFNTAKRLEGVLSVVREEVHDAPLYYTLDRLCGTVHCEMIPVLLFRSAILNAGYNVSYSHANKLSIKTNAPMKLVWDIIRSWTTYQPVKFVKREADPVTKHILSVPITHNIDLTEREDANPESRRDKQTRFQFNPAPHWGPGSKATINTNENRMQKSKINQNKRKAKCAVYSKRRLPSSGEEEEQSNKKTHRQQLIINTTTSEPDSDSATEPVEHDTSINITEPDSHIDNDKFVPELRTAEPPVDNGTTQPESNEGIHEAHTDAKQ